MLLDNIKGANDIKNINPSDYQELAQEIREFLIEKISHTGGHLGSNLGAVELTMALHLFLSPLILSLLLPQWHLLLHLNRKRNEASLPQIKSLQLD